MSVHPFNKKWFLSPSLALSPLLVLVAAGCSDRPKDVAEMRPPIGDLDRRDRGLQSKDVVEASDQLAMYLLQLPDFNVGGRKTMVVTNIENRTTNPRFNYDIFIQRLRTNLGQQGRDRIFLVENKQRVQGLRTDEIEGTPDKFQQGDGRIPSPAESVQPEYALYGVISEMPNRGTSYYFCEFTVTNLRTREQIPLKPYEVRVER
jgi:hypothetical protein